LILWIDAQLSPAIALWINVTFDIQAHAVRDLGLRDAKDLQIFHAARERKSVLMTKDADFLALLDQYGPPPQILWVTCGNTSNARLKEVLVKSLPVAIQMLLRGERLIEISDAR
jgi:predicted nuclease of predicted toxin-antitoxin system